MNDRVIRYGTVVASAVLAALAFLVPAYCWWFVFIFLIPLLCVIISKQCSYSFFHGLLWGLVFFGLHMHGLLYVLIDKAYGKGSFVIWLVLILYCSLFAGLSFWAARMIACKFKQAKVRLLWWIASLFIFFWGIQNVLLVIGGRIEGYPLCHVLLPLAVCPQSLVLLPYCGSSVLMFFLILCNGCLALLLSSINFCSCKMLRISSVASSRYYLAAACICMFPFIIGMVIKKKAVKVPDYVEYTVVVVPHSESRYPLDAAQDIAEQLTRCIEKKRDATLIIMPESSYPFALNEHQRMIQLWADSLGLSDATIIVGSHKREKVNLYNTLYCVRFCRIIQTYDKKHLIPLVEYLPQHFNIPPFNKLFLDHKEQFTDSHSLRPLLFVNDNVRMIPYICSELFFGCENPGQGDFPLLCIANDAWFRARSMRRLLYSLACYRAIEWQKNILYATHHYAQWIDRSGTSVGLAKV